jgi:hypothetical protein
MLAGLQCPKVGINREKGKKQLEKFICRSTSNHRANLLAQDTLRKLRARSAYFLARY